ncbi:MAG: 2'-5' RNA ligase family protein [Bacteroidetes bacterium]|nr:2'-5' RNA ligase family protein [Bacteroidota bacterium]
MKNSIQAIPGYRMYEYSLLLNPHEELRNKIMHVKEQFAEKYKTNIPLHLKPNLTLVNFVQYEMMEERIVQRLKAVAMGFHPIKIELKDFGSFPSHTIFINVVSKLPIQDLVKQVRTETQRLMKPDNDHKPWFMPEPHITIARKLQPWQYEKGWLEYRHRHFTGRFIADAMLLLKRPAGELQYRVAGRFEFQNLLLQTTSTKQGELF